MLMMHTFNFEGDGEEQIKCDAQISNSKKQKTGQKVRYAGECHQNRNLLI
jgi:hypothetical protein